MVSIIILSYNTKDLLEDCLESISSHLKKSSFEIIVVDNASSDGSAQMIKKKFPQVRLIESKDNLGFTRGCNKGAEQAKGDYILFLNSDTVLEADSITPLVSYLQDHTNVGIIGGKMLNDNGTVQRSYGKFYSIGGVGVSLFGGFGSDKAEQLMQKTDKVTKVDWVSGGFMVIKKDVFKKLQGFDEHIFMYLEDMELCFRAHKLGYDVVYNPHGFVVHKGQGSSNRSFAIIHIYKGILYFFKKHKGNIQYTIIKGMLIIKAYMAITVGILTHNKYLTSTYSQALQF